MKNILFCLLLLPVLFLGCQVQDPKKKPQKSLSTLKAEFEKQILHSCLEEAPFSFDFQYRTVFFSDEVISLFGELTVADRLPRGWKQYEGKTYYRDSKDWKEVTLSSLFSTEENRERLKIECENQLKSQPLSPFSGENPLYQSLKFETISTFIVDHLYLIVIFAPYSVGGCSDGPITAKIPLKTLQDEWKIKHPFLEHIKKAIQSTSYISTWECDAIFDTI